MAKAELLSRLRTTGDSLSQTFRRVASTDWDHPVSTDGLTAHGLLDYAMGWLELSGNAYLQSLRMNPQHTAASLDAEAHQYAARRQGRAIASALDDYNAALQGVVILLDMADDTRLDESVAGRHRDAWFTDLIAKLDRVQAEMTAWLDKH